MTLLWLIHIFYHRRWFPYEKESKDMYVVIVGFELSQSIRLSFFLFSRYTDWKHMWSTWYFLNKPHLLKSASKLRHMRRRLPFSSQNYNDATRRRLLKGESAREDGMAKIYRNFIKKPDVRRDECPHNKRAIITHSHKISAASPLLLGSATRAAGIVFCSGHNEPWIMG